MRVASAVTVIFVLVAVYAGAAEPGGWNWGMYFAEVGAGEAVSLGTIAAGIAVEDGHLPFYKGEYGWENVAAISFTLGSLAGGPTGVLLVGELAGAPSDNKFKTYGLTFASTLIYPAITIAAGLAFIDSYFGFYITAFGILSTPIVNPFITASVYNKVKRPKTESTASVNVRPYTNLLADSGAGPVPVYGVSVSF
jgi:hypothetical protein